MTSMIVSSVHGIMADNEVAVAVAMKQMIEELLI